MLRHHQSLLPWWVIKREGYALILDAKCRAMFELKNGTVSTVEPKFVKFDDAYKIVQPDRIKVLVRCFTASRANDSVSIDYCVPPICLKWESTAAEGECAKQ